MASGRPGPLNMGPVTDSARRLPMGSASRRRFEVLDAEIYARRFGIGARAETGAGRHAWRSPLDFEVRRLAACERKGREG